MDVILISYLFAVAISFMVGVPTLIRALRRRDTSLVLLGLAVSIDALEWLAWTLACYSPAVDTPLGHALSISCRLGIIASVLCLLLFTQRVFRPDSRGAKAWALLIASALMASLAGSGAVGDWEGVRSDHVWTWLEQIALMSGYGWTSFEAGRQYRLGKRRLRIGLGDAVVTHRQLLWSVWAAMYFLAEGVYVISFALYGVVSDLDTLNSAFTIVAELALATAVFTPDWYARRISASSTAP